METMSFYALFFSQAALCICITIFVVGWSGTPEKNFLSFVTGPLHIVILIMEFNWVFL